MRTWASIVFFESDGIENSGLRPGSQDVVKQRVAEAEFSWVADCHRPPGAGSIDGGHLWHPQFVAVEIQLTARRLHSIRGVDSHSRISIGSQIWRYSPQTSVHARGATN
jgi:hypothetical protein